MAFVLGEVCGRYLGKDLSFWFLLFCIFLIGATKRQYRTLSLFLIVFCLVFLGAYHNQWFQEKFRLPRGIEEEEEVSVCGTVLTREELEGGKRYRLKKPVLLDQNGQNVKLAGDVTVYGVEEDVIIGNTIVVKGKIKKLKKPTNPGQFNQERYSLAQGILATVVGGKLVSEGERQTSFGETLWQLRKKWSEIYEETMPKKQAGVLMAMVTGEKKQIDQTVKQLYQEQGIAHILAISGLHIGLIGRGIFQQFRKRKCGYWLSGSVAIGFLIVYCMMVGQSPSVFRACMMLLVFLLGEMIGRSYDMLTAMGASAVLLLLKNPYCLFDTGFLLSYGAIIGIGIYTPILEELEMRVRKRWRKEREGQEAEENGGETIRTSFLWNGIRSSVAVQIPTLPILLHTFYGWSPYSFLLNLFVIPMMGVLLPIGFFGGMIGFFSRQWAAMILVFAGIILDGYEQVCKVMEKIPYSFWLTGELGKKFYIPYWIFFTVGIALFYLNKKRQGVALAAFCIGVFLWQPEPTLQIIYADVGQGDGSLFLMPSNRAYLLDGGSSDVKQVGTYRLLPMLHYYGIHTLEGAIVTHLDADHYNGLEELFGQVKIKKLLLPRLLEKDDAYQKLEETAKQYGTKLYYMAEGDTMRDGEVEFSWLSPDTEQQESDKNDNSQVFVLSYGQFRGLFTGDVGKIREEKILESLEPCTVLKVAHHGSKTSSTESFIERVRPPYAVLSYGRKNRYGHPDKDVVERLQSYGATLYATEEKGAILLNTNGKNMLIQPYLSERKE